MLFRSKNLVQPTVANTETQTKDAAGSTLTPDKAEQQSLANSANTTVAEQSTTGEVVKNG